MMKFLRDNFAYILLALIAVVLIFVTISLQVAILSTGETQNSRTIFYTLRQQLAELILPATDTPSITTATSGQPTATAVILPTNTPNVILVEPSPLPTTLPTALALPTATTVAATTPTMTTVQVPGISNASALATRLAAPTATSNAATTSLSAVPTATPNLPPQTTPEETVENRPTNTPQNQSQSQSQNQSQAAVDFRLGYVEGDPECAPFTALLQLVLEREFKLRIATVPFPDPATLFAQLASKAADERVDLSFCYVDPKDRSYLQQYFGFMIFIGSGYRQLDNQKYIIMSNAAVKSPIERGNPCLYRFLTNLNLTDVDLGSGDVAAWYQSHADQVASWTRCE